MKNRILIKVQNLQVIDEIEIRTLYLTVAAW